MGSTLSQARIEANRRNAKKSTGPRTDAGKERSRTNAFKHGLTGLAVALPEEERASLDRFLHESLDELAPRDAAEAELARQALVRVWQVALAERFDGLALQDRRTRAAELYDERQRVELETLVVRLDTEPGAALPRLLGHPLGPDWLVSACDELIVEIESGRIDPTLRSRIIALTRRAMPGSICPTTVELAFDAFFGNTSRLWNNGLPSVPGEMETTDLTVFDFRREYLKSHWHEYKASWVAEILCAVRAARERFVVAANALTPAVLDEKRRFAIDAIAAEVSEDDERRHRYHRALEAARSRAIRDLRDWRRLSQERREPEPESVPQPGQATSPPPEPAPEVEVIPIPAAKPRRAARPQERAEVNVPVPNRRHPSTGSPDLPLRDQPTSSDLGFVSPTGRAVRRPRTHQGETGN